ncbi:MAG TPA: type I-E CRISPR-associated protein Cas6/Cse3/CasE [Sphingomicrobium sp.]|nr:type I-E CRISPR-associated protein Cas6/Cse3/CasE [Sphingomicrobium sp.]
MTPSLHLSRLTLKKTSEITPLINVLQPAGRGDGIEADHRLIWTAMPEELQKAHRLDRGGTAFLWRRDDRPGRYFVLGPRPRPDSSFFDIETKPFEAHLAPGDRLEFVLRVNATVDRRSDGRDGKTERRDVAMDLLHPVARNERADHRQELAQKGATDWLAARSEASGFRLETLHLDGYRAVAIRRNRHKKPGQIGVFDLRGLVTVTAPDAFLDRLRTGFGRAKAFGCGLMLIRRAG